MTSANDDALLVAYNATLWVGPLPSGGVFSIRLRGETDDLCGVFDVDAVAIVTASNPASVPLDDATNAKRNAELVDVASSMGLRVVPCIGIGSGDDGAWWEASHVVLDPTPEQALELGSGAGQNCIVWIERGAAPQLVVTRDGFAARRVGTTIT